MQRRPAFALFFATMLESARQMRLVNRRSRHTFLQLGATMSLDSLHDLYVEELKDLYNAENQLLKALPKMAKKASAPELKAAFTEHLEVTQKQVERLEQIFNGLDASPKGKKCKAMEGLVEEGSEVIEEDGNPSVIDAA